MVQTDTDGVSPKSWGDVRMVILGDSLVGGLSFKESPPEERPKLRARAFKKARLHHLLAKVEPEIINYKPHLLVLCGGQSDLIHVGCQHFPNLDHQHRVLGVDYQFNVKLAAEEIFRLWHSWLANYACKVVVALPYAMNFQEYNTKKLTHCHECQELYTEQGQREKLCKRIEEWGELLKQQNVPMIYIGDVLKKINSDYMDNDPIIEENERALIDGLRVSKKFPQNFLAVLQEEVLKTWPNFLGDESSVEPEEPDSPTVATSSEAVDEASKEENSVALPPKKKTKHMFRF